MRRIEKRGAVNVLCDDDGNGCMPATRAEIEFFDEITRLRAEVEALRADAERYRWLRDVGDGNWRPMANRVPGGAAVIDASIDDAIAARAAQGGRG